MDKPIADCNGLTREILAHQFVAQKEITDALEAGEVTLKAGTFVRDDSMPVPEAQRIEQKTLSRHAPSIEHHFGRWAVSGSNQEQTEPSPARLAVNSKPRNLGAKVLRKSAVTVTSIKYPEDK